MLGFLSRLLAGANTTTVTPPQLPNVTLPDPLNLTDFVSWWNAHTYGLFSILLGPVAVASVYLKTRSLSATLVAAVTVASVYTGKWILVFAALAFSGLLWAVWRRSGD